jgi:hypothetical protein
MEPTEIAKQMIDLHKTTFNNTFQTLVMLQDQTEKMAMAMLDQTPGLTKEGKEAIDTWMKTFKKGRDDFKKLADENYQKIEEFFKTAK